MEMHIFGVLYTVLFVILCVMFIGTFSEKRDLSGKWCRYAFGRLLYFRKTGW